jgi:fatty acid desaturase
MVMKHKKSFLRYNIDIISVFLVFLSVLISLLPLYLNLNLSLLVIIFLFSLFIKPTTSLVQHNHVHYSIFNNKILNQIFDLLLSISTGHISSEWVLHHNIGHHGNEINSLEDTSSVKNPKTRKYMTKLEYIISGSLKIFPDCCKMAWTFYKQNKKHYLQTLIFEQTILISIYAYFLSVNFKMALIFLILSNMISRSLVWLGAYWHHLNVPANSAYDSTNMYTKSFFNLISFNIGYHIAHHEKPTLHWSKLKARTTQIIDRIPESQILSRIP